MQRKVTPSVPRRPQRTTAAGLAALAALAVWGLACSPEADVSAAPPALAAETASVVSLAAPGDHWLWVPDRLFQHSLLFDGDTGQVLGMLDSGQWLTPQPPILARTRGEILSVDVAYSRGRRGERLDFVTIYDARTLEPTGEVIVPTRSAESNTSLAYAELLDGERFLAIFNQFPNASVSIVDLEQRRFVGEEIITGCAGIYATGPRSFATLCGDGTVTEIRLDLAGRKRDLRRSDRFFDVVEDPVAMSAARDGARWLFVTFRGDVVEVEFGEDAPRAGAPWSLVAAGERDAGWRPGGLQYVAIHRASRRLFVVMHRGQPGSHKEAGPEIWVHDLAQRERVARFDAPNLAAAFLGPFLEIEEGSLVDRALAVAIPNQGIHTLVVTQDAQPLLFARNAELGAVGVLDARTGETLRTLREAGVAGPTLRVP